MLDIDFVNACIGFEVDGQTVKVMREIDGGKEILEAKLPLVLAGQKGMVEEKDLRIPNMRGIMMARQKPLTVIEPSNEIGKSESTRYEKPPQKSACKMIDADNLDELISLLHNEAKVI
jgi:electron transfer flavoprotein beta subunit